MIEWLKTHVSFQDRFLWARIFGYLAVFSFSLYYFENFTLKTVYDDNPSFSEQGKGHIENVDLRFTIKNTVLIVLTAVGVIGSLGFLLIAAKEAAERRYGKMPKMKEIDDPDVYKEERPSPWLSIILIIIGIALFTLLRK